MSDRFVRALPWIGAAGLVVAVLMLGVCSSERQRMLADNGETRRAVEPALNAVLDRHPASIDDASFRSAVANLSRARYMATVWLFSADGRLVSASGSTAASTPTGKTAEDLATEETVRVLGAVEGALPPSARTLALVASSIMREGEHNDVYRHLARPITAASGSVEGYLGIAYAASPSLAAPVSAAWILELAAFTVGLAVYWMALPLWVFLDARARGDRAWIWAAFVLVGNLVALMAYLLARAPRPAFARP
jgi:hypothetical protein